MRVIYTLRPGLDGRRIRLTTDTTTDYRRSLPIEGTRLRIAIPYSVRLDVGFTIGRIKFTPVEAAADKRKPHWARRIVALHPSEPLPEAWLVDLSGDVFEDAQAA